MRLALLFHSAGDFLTPGMNAPEIERIRAVLVDRAVHRFGVFERHTACAAYIGINQFICAQSLMLLARQFPRAEGDSPIFPAEKSGQSPSYFSAGPPNSLRRTVPRRTSPVLINRPGP
jgi:hypothetical protein